MNRLTDRRILIGVTGGIAAYKAAELVRLLRAQGAEVRVVMTAAATAFITPLTLQALSGHAVRSELFDPAHEAAMGHIELARWAEQIVIAPASADFLARLRAGMANDLLSTLCLASEAPLLVAPAMNRVMWQAAATMENVAVLEGRGVRLLGPASGSQACGEEGAGRMVEPAELVEAVIAQGLPPLLDGVAVTITAGPTREGIDPVRFLSNRSSGKMGFALARAMADLGAQVRLVAGPVALATPTGVVRVDVESAEQMFEAVMGDSGDIFIGCAAVADYRPAQAASNKIKKAAATMTLALERNPDILAEVCALPRPPFCVGFAAETDDLERYARGKLESKGADLIAANWVGERADGGFEVDTNQLTLFWRDGERTLPLSDKRTLARELATVIAEHYIDKRR